MLLLDKKVIEENQFTDYETDGKCIDVAILLSNSKEVEVLDIDEVFPHFVFSSTYSLGDFCKEHNLKLINIKE